MRKKNKEIIWNYFRKHIKKFLNTFEIRNVETKFKFENAKQ